MEHVYVSLGSDCSVAYQLQIHGLRQSAFPFDWIRINNLDSLISILESNFQFFFDDLTIERESDKFPLIEEDWKDNISKTLIIKNTKYSILFPHDIKTIDDLEEFKIKYSRRIARFLDIIKNPTIKKTFIRASGKKENYDKLNNCLNKIANNYELIMVHYDNKIKYSSWKHDEYQWNDIFL